MASYELLLKRSARKELDALPPKDRTRIVPKIQALADQPRPAKCEKLSGQERYRIRQGVYRVLYEIDDGLRTVTIVKIGYSGEVYR
ncbi:MAG: type II toxin-antitoxin system RelE family toxin [Gemmatimonadota bacterium]